MIAACWPCWTIASPSSATGKCFSIACRTTNSQLKSATWRNSSMFEVSVEQTFASAHALRNYRGGCENVHGHNFRVLISVQGEHLDATGLLVDFLEVKSLIAGVVDGLDHQ